MKRIFLFSLFFLLVLAACERPAREVPEDVTDEETPTNAIDEAKPEEALPEGSTDPATDPATATEDEAAGEADTEGTGEAAAEGDGSESAPAETDTTTEPATEAELPQNVTYEIQSGDTLFAIGLLYGVSVDDIVTANNLSSADSLEVGQLIIVPVGGLPETTETPDDGGEQTVDPPAASEQIHIVSAGQTLYSIGLSYGFTVEELATYNNLANPDSLEVGQEIKIPPQ